MRVIDQDGTFDMPYEKLAFVINTHGGGAGSVDYFVLGGSEDWHSLSVGTYTTPRAAQIVLYKMRCAYEDGERVFRMPQKEYAARIDEEEKDDEGL